MDNSLPDKQRGRPLRGGTGKANGSRLLVVVTAVLVGAAALLATVNATPANASTVGGSITRSEVLSRALNWVGNSNIQYSQDQSNAYPSVTGERYRPDCSGFVSMAWHLSKLPSGWDYNTDTLPQVSTPIIQNELKPGDIMLRQGTNGHVTLFNGWRDSSHTTYNVLEQGSAQVAEFEPGVNYPHAAIYRWDTAWQSGFRPYRYQHIIDDLPGDLGVLDFLLSDSVASHVNTRPVIHYGNSPMVPIVGDWDGDGKDTVSAYDPTAGTFLISNNPETGQAQYVFRYGNPGAVPLVGDWDGDGKDNVGVQMGNGFYLRTSPVTSGVETTSLVRYGDAGDTPLIGDWDGDGKDNVGVYKPGLGRFFLRMSANTDPTETTIGVSYGNPGVTPLVGDWNGDGRDNIGVRMGNTFYFRTSEVTSSVETTVSIAYGNGSNEYPITGDWDGDGKDTQGIVA